MKKNLLSYAALFAAITFSFTSCKDDPAETVKNPVANFDFTYVGKTATFTNGSTDATTYLWNFGDNSTSTDESPVHEYAKYGKFTVMLIATGGSNKADTFEYEITLIKKSVVSLTDNTHADWKDIPDAFVSVDGNGGLLNKVKVDYDADNIYFYLESSAPADSVYGVQFDLDNDSTTGYKGWANKGIGGDVYMEGQLPWGNGWGLFTFKDDSPQNEWGWQVVDGATNYVFGGFAEKSGNLLKAEFSVPIAKLVKGNLTVKNKVGIQMHQYQNWTPAGFFAYSLDLTK